MRRILLMVLRNLLIVPGGWIKLCYRSSHVDKYTEEDNYEFLRWIVFRANKGGNVTIEAYGKENIPKEGGFMFFPNHQGLYDVLAIVDACPRPFSVVAKKEVAIIASGDTFKIRDSSTNVDISNEISPFSYLETVDTLLCNSTASSFKVILYAIRYFLIF